MAATIGGLLFAGGARGVISQKAGLSLQLALTYNVVDMAVSALVLQYFRNHNANFTPPQLLLSRVCGMIAGLAVVGAVYGPMDILIAIALNGASLAVDAIMLMSARREQILLV